MNRGRSRNSHGGPLVGRSRDMLRHAQNVDEIRRKTEVNKFLKQLVDSYMKTSNAIYRGCDGTKKITRIPYFLPPRPTLAQQKLAQADALDYSRLFPEMSASPRCPPKDMSSAYKRLPKIDLNPVEQAKPGRQRVPNYLGSVFEVTIYQELPCLTPVFKSWQQSGKERACLQTLSPYWPKMERANVSHSLPPLRKSTLTHSQLEKNNYLCPHEQEVQKQKPYEGPSKQRFQECPLEGISVLSICESTWSVDRLNVIDDATEHKSGSSRLENLTVEAYAGQYFEVRNKNASKKLKSFLRRLKRVYKAEEKCCDWVTRHFTT